MSIKLKDTIYDLVNKSIKDSSGNTITSTYLPLSGGTMTGTGYIIFSRTVGAGTTGIYISGTETSGMFLASNEVRKKLFLESTNQSAPIF